MADPNDRDFSLNNAFETGFISGSQLPDSPSTCSSESSKRSGSDYSDSNSSGSKRTSELAASLRMFSESLLRMEMAEMEMMKTREAARLEAENRRLEKEDELTQMILRTQLEVASVVTRTLNGRKRKRSNDALSQREGTMLMSLLQCNLFV